MQYTKPDALIDKDRIRIIHVAKSKLGLEEEIYRDILFVNAKVHSSKDLTLRGYWKVMDHFKEIGREKGVKIWTDSGSSGGRRGKKMRPFQEPNKGVWLSQQKQKAICGLWEDVARNKSPQALTAFIKNRFGIDNLRFADEGTGDKIIEALKQMKHRQNPGWSGKLGDY